MLKRPTQAQVARAIEVLAPAAPKAPQAPALADMQVEAIVTLVHRNDWNRDRAKEIIGHIAKKGYALDTAFKRSEGDTFAYLVKEDSGVRTVVKIGPSADGEKLLAYLDTLAPAAQEYRVKVRQYMTKPASPDFDFQDRYNEGKPMPMRTMFGKVLQETKGMVKMELYGKPEPTSECMHCGRDLTHPVSLLYGIGPKCGQHFHINPLGSEEELQAAYEDIRSKLADVRWCGWIIRKAIESMEEVEA